MIDPGVKNTKITKEETEQGQKTRTQQDPNKNETRMQITEQGQNTNLDKLQRKK